MNPVSIDDIRDSSENLLVPEFLICTSFDTHNAIHYGDEGLLSRDTITVRSRNDTSPWRNQNEQHTDIH